MTASLPAPCERASWVGDPGVVKALRRRLNEGVLSHGWLITGPEGVGKATLAYQIAKAALAPESLVDDASLTLETGARAARMVAARAHPDLFVAERRWDEKKARFETEITVQTIRNLASFLNRTPSMGAWRVAVVDAADDLNRNAANALLKALEEPPARCLLLLLCARPGRLIATIRSRCRRIDLRPLDDAAMVDFLRKEPAASDADIESIARAARGRPGFALELAAGEGGEAVAAGEAFLKAASTGGDISAVTARLTGKAGDARWEIFKAYVTDAVSDAARAAATGAPAPMPAQGQLQSLGPKALVEIWSRLNDLASRCDALNIDRAQTIMAMQRAFADKTLIAAA